MAGIAWVCTLAACTNGEGNEPNILPTPPTGTSTSAGSTTDVMPTGSESGPGPQTGSGTTGEQDITPRTYRFDCLDIRGVGDADDSAIQAQVLENTWGGDIEAFKLNILMEVAERNPETGEAQLGIRSGIGGELAGMCAQPDTISDLIPVSFVPGETRYGPASGDGACSDLSSGTAGNTYEMQLPPERVVYIYAQDDDTTPFNCTPDAGTPDAVPIRAVQAEVSTDASEGKLWGRLNGCLLQTDAASLCSCLGSCAGEGPDDVQTDGVCAGCPVGSNPLEVLLGGVNPSENCTSIMGEPAFDLLIGFQGTALPDVPTSCG